MPETMRMYVKCNHIYFLIIFFLNEHSRTDFSFYLFLKNYLYYYSFQDAIGAVAVDSIVGTPVSKVPLDSKCSIFLLTVKAGKGKDGTDRIRTFTLDAVTSECMNEWIEGIFFVCRHFYFIVSV